MRFLMMSAIAERNVSASLPSEAQLVALVKQQQQQRNPSDPHEGNWVVRLISASLASSFASRLVVVVAPAAASSSSSEKNIFLVFVFSSLRREEDSSFTKSSSQLTRSPEPVVTSITWGAHLKLHTGRRRRKKKKRCEGWKKKKDDYTNNDCVPRVQEQHDIYLWW